MSVASAASAVGSIGGVASAATSLSRKILGLTGGSDGSWETSLRQASYGEIKFGVIGATTVAGRKQVVHEYAFRDEAWVEDLGKRARRFNVSGFLLEDDLVYKGGPVIAQREALLKKIEEAADPNSPGWTLVHPTLGKIANVCCLDCEITEKLEHGRYFELKFDFIISGKRKFPASKQSTSETIQLAASKTELQAILDFVSKVATGVAQAAAFVTGVVSTVMRWYTAIQGLVNDVRRFISAVSNLGGNFGTLFGGGNSGYTGSNVKAPATATAQSLLIADTVKRGRVAAAGAALVTAAATPAKAAEFGAAVLALVGEVAASATDPRDAIRMLMQMVRSAAPDPTIQVPDTAAAQAATSALLRRTTLAALARAIAIYQPASSDDAIALRGQAVALFDDEIQIAGDDYDDGAYTVLLNLRKAVTIDLTERGAQLTSMAQFSYRGAVSSLPLANRIYRDARRADDLVQQVQPIHPAFMPRSFKALAP